MRGLISLLRLIAVRMLIRLLERLGLAKGSLRLVRSALCTGAAEPCIGISGYKIIAEQLCSPDENQYATTKECCRGHTVHEKEKEYRHTDAYKHNSGGESSWIALT